MVPLTPKMREPPFVDGSKSWAEFAERSTRATREVVRERIAALQAALQELRVAEEKSSVLSRLQPFESGVPRRIGIQAFVSLTERWQIAKAAWPILLGRSPSTIRTWLRVSKGGINREVPLAEDVQERISHLVSIYDGLHRLFGDVPYSDSWIQTPNHAFGDQTPLERLLRGDLASMGEVRSYVERALNDG